MLQEGKVSVVVPIFKVEKYLHRCVDSIIDQSYKNIEIILVDDGSPDNCGSIADQYGETESRIKVIHKRNGGLSDARNHGLKHVTGEFTVFVDSDDWLEMSMIENLVKNSWKYKADVVQSGFFYAYEEKLLFDNRYHSKNGEPELLTKETLMYELVSNEKVKNFAWGKLYKTKIIRDIPFEKGVLFEDVFWAHKVMHQVNTFLILHQPLYNYYQRSDSIVATYTPRNLDIIRGLKERHGFIEEFYKELTDESYKAILKMSLIHYNLLLRNRKIDHGGLYRKEIQSYISTNYSKLKKAVKNEKQLTQQLHLFSLHPYLNVLYLGLGKGLKTLKILPQPDGLELVKIKQ
ncbi:glycosyltransferase family 2 protein [Peribacillus cavernae]|uniref:Glycosyltransferase family 2 protein n=1 Tax=Peribacillus cavernae TaxID=1674310 RepID=A0A3S1B7Q4_9BACI|nr:glycosyltransferase family 2 protein [Peribacillus cavernae]MDQ0217484.1 glycosyltransferase involved in cell wall biosynthesis [Peribacillus cavernae]RUQ30074.1 glycosyltransferase family 2 protein [Peribacillus cavernae]